MGRGSGMEPCVVIEPPPGGEFLDSTIRNVRCTRSSRTAAVADFDGDGRLEIVTNNFNDGPYLFRNQLPRHSWISVRLEGTRSNRDAVGAIVRIPLNGQILTRHLQTSGGYLAQSSKILHFGLGDAKSVPEIEIWWPNGTRQTVRDLEINRQHRFVEPQE